ncbi:hypothetical protein JGU66_01725 [Myxococcaceae bacterium JPH2]|nr:hypothetical protein [Myxococcaceae bacterium JPH2]
MTDNLLPEALRRLTAAIDSTDRPSTEKWLFVAVAVTPPKIALGVARRCIANATRGMSVPSWIPDATCGAATVEDAASFGAAWDRVREKLKWLDSNRIVLPCIEDAVDDYTRASRVTGDVSRFTPSLWRALNACVAAEVEEDDSERNPTEWHREREESKRVSGLESASTYAEKARSMALIAQRRTADSQRWAKQREALFRIVEEFRTETLRPDLAPGIDSGGCEQSMIDGLLTEVLGRFEAAINTRPINSGTADNRAQIEAQKWLFVALATIPSEAALDVTRRIISKAINSMKVPSDLAEVFRDVATAKDAASFNVSAERLTEELRMLELEDGLLSYIDDAVYEYWRSLRTIGDVSKSITLLLRALYSCVGAEVKADDARRNPREWQHERDEMKRIWNLESDNKRAEEIRHMFLSSQRRRADSEGWSKRREAQLRIVDELRTAASR